MRGIRETAPVVAAISDRHRSALQGQWRTEIRRYENIGDRRHRGAWRCAGRRSKALTDNRTPGEPDGPQNFLAFSKISYRFRPTHRLMAPRRPTKVAHPVKTYPRAVFKLFNQAPMSSTVLSRNNGGFWIQGGKLANFLGSCDYSGVEVDVCFLPSEKVEWYKIAPQNSKSAETET